jgi:tRNA nucleotidyltransferase (CCA-adding enzyme)
MQEILNKIKPSKEEQNKLQKLVSTFIKKLNSNLKDAKATLGGSGAKDTWLSGNHDIDIFVQFDYQKYKDQSTSLSELLEKSIKKSFPKIKIERLHGSRDYFQINHQDYVFEIVPVLKIIKMEQALNITDISPLHSVWVNKHTKKIKDDIRLAKQFCRANNLYGAESYLSGFSGYVLEILIAYYGSFQKLLKESQKWKLKQVIDPEKYYPTKNVFFELNKSKLQSPLIIIDPVDKDRNASAALSLEKFKLFQKKAKLYLKNPNVSLFEKEEISYDQLKTKTKKGHLVFFSAIVKKNKEDVMGYKLLKSFQFLKRELEVFGVKESGWDWDHKKTATIYFILNNNELSEYEFRQGPPIKLKEFVKNFKKKNKDTFTKNGKLFAKIKVKYPQLDDFVNNFIKNEYLNDKQVRIKQVR